MSEPRRLLDSQQTSATTAELLRALEPPQAAPPAVQAGLAQQLSVLVAQGGVHAAAAGAAWLKVALVTTALAGSGAALWKLVDRSTPPPPQASAAGSGALASPAPPAPVPLASAPPDEAPSTEQAPAERPRAAPAPSAPRDKLAEEEALLEEARTLLGQQPSRALSLLRRHQSQFPGGQLSAERMYLSVDCLRRLGRRAEAQREVDALVARYPSSAYARRAPQLLTAPGR